MCSKLTIKTPERHIVNFEHTLHNFSFNFEDLIGPKNYLISFPLTSRFMGLTVID